LKAKIETRKSHSGCSRVGIEPRRFHALWVNWIKLVQPRRGGARLGVARSRTERGIADHDVALQVAFESQILKPVFSLDRC
jgi:hypothetical protein